MILGYILLILAGTGISYYIYYIKNKLNATERLGAIFGIFSPAMNPIIAGILFYLSCNIFPIISIIKNKKNQTFLWYLLAPTLFFVLWLIIDLFTSSIMSSTLM